MAEPRFRLPTAGFDQVRKILKAYVSAARNQPDVPVGLDDVARRAAINRTVVSGNNGFLASVGLLEGGNAKRLTPLGVRAAVTLDYPGTPEAQEVWTEVVNNSPDLERVVDAVRIRQGMDEDALLSHIALTAGVPKSSRFLTGARTIVDMLEFAGLLVESDDVFQVSAVDNVVTSTGRATHALTEEVVPPVQQTGRPRPASAAGIVVNVHVWVNASEADFDELGDELREFLSKLSSS